MTLWIYIHDVRHMDELSKQFVADVEAYAKSVGQTVATVSRRAVGDSKLIKRITSGGSCTFVQAARVRAWIAANPPPKDTPESPGASLGETGRGDERGQSGTDAVIPSASFDSSGARA